MSTSRSTSTPTRARPPTSALTVTEPMRHPSQSTRQRAGSKRVDKWSEHEHTHTVCAKQNDTLALLWASVGAHSTKCKDSEMYSNSPPGEGGEDETLKCDSKKALPPNRPRGRRSEVPPESVETYSPEQFSHVDGRICHRHVKLHRNCSGKSSSNAFGEALERLCRGRCGGENRSPICLFFRRRRHGPRDNL